MTELDPMDMPQVEETALPEKDPVTPPASTDMAPQLVDDQPPIEPKKALIGAALGAVVAALLLYLGFWPTLFLVVLALVGAFLAGVTDKTQFLKDLINRLFPPKNR